ncbi:MAG: phage tail protein [bacterium]
MRTGLTPPQLEILNASVKKVSWLFEVDRDNDGTVDYYWSTEGKSFGGHNYSPKIMSFSPLVIAMGSLELGVIPPARVTITVSFSGNTIGGLGPSAFEDASITIRLAGEANGLEAELMAWRLRVVSAWAVDQVLTLECQDRFTINLEGDYPNLPLISDLFPSDIMKNDNVCVPLVFGTPFFPVRWISSMREAIFVDAATFTTAGDQTALFTPGQFVLAHCGVDGNLACWVENSSFNLGLTTVRLSEASGSLTSNLVRVSTDHYLLGPADKSYTIDRARTPQEVNFKTTYLSTDYTFKQDSVAGADGAGYRVVQLLCDDANNDGSNDANGFWGIAGKQIYDLPLRFSRSDLAGTTNPADIATWILEDWGILPGEIDDVSRLEAAATFAARGLDLNIGLWYRMPREKLISKLFSVTGMIPLYRDKIGFKVLTTASQMAIEEDMVKPGSFQVKRTFTQKRKDSGYVTWQVPAEPVDQLNKTLVAVKSTAENCSDTTIEAEWILDAVKARKCAQLALQRILLKDREITFTAHSRILSLEPGDMITINPANFGAEGVAYTCLITKMTIHEGLWVDVECTRFSDTLDDWDDLSAPETEVSQACAERGYSPIYQGPPDAAGSTALRANQITGTVLIGSGGTLATSNNPAVNGGLLATNMQLTCYSPSGQVRFQAIYGGADQGDVTLGNYAQDAGAKWDQSAGVFEVKGRISTGEGSIAGWNISATKISKTGIELDSAFSRLKAFSGSNSVVLDPNGLIGHSSVLGDVFKILTNGSAPEFSSGKIKECEYQIYTSGIIKTSDNPATDGGLLINHTSMTGYNTSGQMRFQAVYSGVDQGDVTIGDFTAGKGIRWDQSAGTLIIKVSSTGGVTVSGGGDITLSGSDTDPGRLKFAGTSYAVEIGGDTDGNRFLIKPDVNNAVDCYVGLNGAWWGDPDARFRDLRLTAKRQGSLSCGDWAGAVNGAAVEVDGDSNDLEPAITLSLYDKTSQNLRQYNIRSGLFGPQDHKVQDLGKSTAAWDDAYADDWHNVADFFFLDHRGENGEIIPVDDLEIIKAIRPSGVFDPRTGMEIIDDNSLPEWLLSRDKVSGKILYDQEGKPYLSLKAVISLCLGAIRQLDRKITEKSGGNGNGPAQ